MARILIVDDERDLVWAVSRSLTAAGHETIAAYGGAEALAAARRHHPDCVILDIMMPHMDGLQVLQALRRDPKLGTVPVLCLTARRAVEDRVRALSEGADDYLCKPFDLRELHARVTALVRRAQPRVPPSPGRLVAGPLELDVAGRRVHTDGRFVALTPTEFDLLYHLMSRQGEVFSSQDLLTMVWGYPPDTSDEGLVRWHVKNLREKIEQDPARPVYLRTVPRHGYVLSVPASEVPETGPRARPRRHSRTATHI
ncbi:MAG: response regulator transcription factor [Armatimonadota bacterium]|nr:response regulator transcription factor [Armatimonadota bacterium]